MNVLFLDIDGTLVTERSFVGLGDADSVMDQIDPVGAGLLNSLWEVDPDLRVVVSSTWRIGRTRAEMTKILRLGGFRGQLHEDWRTKIMDDARRGDEVAEWLSRHPEVTRFACLDDETDFLDGQPLVRTEPGDGILTSHWRELQVHLFGAGDAVYKARFPDVK